MSHLFHMTERADLVAAEDDVCRSRFENSSLSRFLFGYKLDQTSLYLGSALRRRYATGPTTFSSELDKLATGFGAVGKGETR